MISFKTPSSHLFLPEIQALQTLLENKPANSCDAQMAMAPMPRPINRGDKAGKPRVGAVLALLYPKQDDIHLILTKRPDSMRDHSGQVSFPGGKQDAGETLPQTALRETHEEIGIPPHEITLLGRLSSLYISPTDFEVHPFVGWCPRRPVFKLNEAEVAHLIEAPLPYLSDPQTISHEKWMLRELEINVPYYAVDGEKVWGATAMMLSELLALWQHIRL